MIVSLSLNDLDAICMLEARAFDEGMRASRESYKNRFALGHIMLGYEIAEELCGIIGFSYGSFNPDDLTSIPASFSEWSSQPSRRLSKDAVPKGMSAAFIYNLGVIPDNRGSVIARTLVHAAIEVMGRNGCEHIIGEGPVPSYAGNTQIKQNPKISRALDEANSRGITPDEKLLFTDPHLALYRRFWPCSILCIKPDFIPEDKASGGFRVLLYSRLERSEEKVSLNAVQTA